MPLGLRLCLGGFILATATIGLCRQIRYRISHDHLEIRLFGIRLRRLALNDIRYVSKHRSGWGEVWWNTPWPAKRILVIRRRTGWCKNFIITPANRYVFKSELKRAMKSAVKGRA
jgi:hypothetical protein